jgi:dephospho-CoA kinase
MKIAVTGEIRSGKDSVCDYIMSNVPNCERLYFAEGIEEIIRKYFPEAFKFGKPRKHFQDIGQFMRSIDKDVWVKFTAEKYELLNSISNYNFLCTDLRQPNEYEWLKENGFIVIKVDAEFQLRKERALKAGDVFTEETFNHPVEQAIRSLPYDYLITNNTTLDDLYKQVDFILEGEITDGIS